MLGVVVDEAVDVTVLEIVLVLLPEHDAVLLGVLELDAVLDPVFEGVVVWLGVWVDVFGGVVTAEGVGEAV